MAILWSVTEAEIIDILDSKHFESGGKWNSNLIAWGNRAVTDIAMDIDVRYHLSTDSSTLVFTDTDESKALPTNFLKMSERFTKARIGDELINIIGLDKLRSFDPAHDQTTGGDVEYELALYVDGVRIAGATNVATIVCEGAGSSGYIPSIVTDYVTLNSGQIVTAKLEKTVGAAGGTQPIVTFNNGSIMSNSFEV